MTEPANALDVFINCPFDSDYQPIFRGFIFTIIRCGFRARCALEVDDASDIRMQKIARIIKECPLGVHDISRTETSGEHDLPRFNMPLELGLYLGAKYYGAAAQKRKSCIIFERTPFLYQRYISDIAGQDIKNHGNDVGAAIQILATWFRGLRPEKSIPGGVAIAAEYAEFQEKLPAIAEQLKLNDHEIQFVDFVAIVTGYLTAPSSAE